LNIGEIPAVKGLDPLGGNLSDAIIVFKASSAAKQAGETSDIPTEPVAPEGADHYVDMVKARVGVNGASTGAAEK
jgi:hypothetical protein